jgi:hypothetical protein
MHVACRLRFGLQGEVYPDLEEWLTSYTGISPTPRGSRVLPQVAWGPVRGPKEDANLRRHWDRGVV